MRLGLELVAVPDASDRVAPLAEPESIVPVFRELSEATRREALPDAPATAAHSASIVELKDDCSDVVHPFSKHELRAEM